MPLNISSAEAVFQGCCHCVGVIDDASWFRPDAYVYASKKLPHTPVDPETTAYEKMRTT